MFDSIYYNQQHHPFDYNNHLLSNNFPSNLLDDDELFIDTILPYYPPPPPPPPQPVSNLSAEISNIRHDSNGRKRVKGVVRKKQDGGGGGASSRRKAGKKDRHSKIYTAQGPRDRRMRLSLQIARKFFDLQDMLGFDKASKTIEWLFSKSRAAIKDLTDKSRTTTIISNNDGGDKKKEKLWCEGKNDSNDMRREKYRMNNEKRKEARARARKRTKEKLIMKNKEVLKLEKNPNNNNNCLVNDGVRVYKVGQLGDQMASVGIIEKFLAASSSMADFGDGGSLDGGGAFSMEFQGSRVSESSSINGSGLLEELVVNSEYNNQVQGPNCAFMDFNY